MPSTGYRYYTVVMANALLAAGHAINDSSKRRPDQYLRNLVSAYGYEADHEVSYATLLHDLERDGLLHFLDDLKAKNYWGEFIGRVALSEAAGHYTMSDPLLPLLNAAAAFERAVGMLFDAGDLVAGSDLHDLRYLLDRVTLDEVVQQIAGREPALANALLRATRRGGAPFDEHPLGAQFVLARLFQLTEDLTGRLLYERTEGKRKGTGRSVASVVAEVAERNPALAEQIKRLLVRAPSYLGLAESDASFRPQHVRPEPTREGNPLKILAQMVKKEADPALRIAVERVGDLHRDPALSLVLAFALPGAISVLGMLEQALELRHLGDGDDWRFPSGRTLLAWLYASEAGVAPAWVLPEFANFAERDRLGLACPSVLAEEARAYIEQRLASHGLEPREGGGADVVTGFTAALMDVLPTVASGSDSDRLWHESPESRTAAEVLWAKATYPHLIRSAQTSDAFWGCLKALPALRGRPVPWKKILKRPGTDESESELPRHVGLDFTEVWPREEAPLAPHAHPFGVHVTGASEVEGDAATSDERLKDWAFRLEQRRSEVLPKTTNLLLRTLEAWVEQTRLQDAPHVADARTRLFFMDGGEAGERAGFSPHSVGLPTPGVEAWASNGPPACALVECFMVGDEAGQADCEPILDALQAFSEVVREVEHSLQREWWRVMKEMNG